MQMSLELVLGILLLSLAWGVDRVGRHRADRKNLWINRVNR